MARSYLFNRFCEAVAVWVFDANFLDRELSNLQWEFARSPSTFFGKILEACCESPPNYFNRVDLCHECLKHFIRRVQKGSLKVLHNLFPFRRNKTTSPNLFFLRRPCQEVGGQRLQLLPVFRNNLPTKFCPQAPLSSRKPASILRPIASNSNLFWPFLAR